MELLIDRVPSPIGTVLLVSDGEALRALDFGDYEARFQELLERHYGACTLTPATDPGGFSSRLRAYFDGELDVLDHIPVRTNGTVFQQEVWTALREIPAGTTMSYGQLAARVGKPKASRAVGLANGANPVAIVVPCHRVIGANARLTGYGGGIERKRWLLAHEARSTGLFGARQDG